MPVVDAGGSCRYCEGALILEVCHVPRTHAAWADSRGRRLHMRQESQFTGRHRWNNILAAANEEKQDAIIIPLKEHAKLAYVYAARALATYVQLIRPLPLVDALSMPA